MSNPNPPEINSAIAAIAVTTSDSTNLSLGFTRGIYVGGSGDVAVTMADGNTVTFKSLAAGIIHPICVTRIWSTGTTATNIVALR